MNKRIPLNDITYCANKNCKKRNICFRNLDNYDSSYFKYYCFSNFKEENCKNFSKMKGI